MLKRLTSPSALEAPSQVDGGFDMREAIHFVWRQWRFIAAITAIALLLGAIHVARQTSLYTASAQLLLDPVKEKAGGPDSIYLDTLPDQSHVDNQMAIIRSTALLRRVVEKERLLDDPEFGGARAPASGGLMATLRGLFGKSPDAPPADARDSVRTGELTPELARAVESLKGSTQAARSGQASVINVSFTSADPAKAARLANAIVDAYVVDKLDARFEAAKRASAWLSDRLVELRQQLRESEEAVAKLRADNNLAQSSPSATLSQEQLGQMNARLVAARAETAEKKARLDLLQKMENDGASLAALPEAVASSAIAELRRQENDLTRQEADLLARYSERHPSVVNVRAQIADIRRAVGAEVRRLSVNIKNEYELARARQAAVEKTLRDVTGQTDIDNAKAITLRELERNVAVNKNLFEDFLQRSRVTQEQASFQARDARVITPAVRPGAPSEPKKFRIMLGALIMGLLAGVGGAYAMELMNAGFSTPRQIEEMLELPLLASISRMEARDLTVDGVVLSMPEYPLAKPLSRFSESIRSLRSAVQMSDVDFPPRVLQITSTLPGEGKTTMALTIAASAAQSGLKTLLMDCDLRRTSASRFFRNETTVGLVDYLAGDIELQKAFTYDQKRRLWVLPAGAHTQSPPDLLASDRLKQLLVALREQFDLIVIDTPPMGPVADPVIVSQLADKIIYVVRWASTAREMVAHSIARLSGRKKVAGVVFNHVVDRRAQKYGRYAYAYYYGGQYYKKYYNE